MRLKVIISVLILAFAAVLLAATWVGASDIPVDEKKLNTSGMAAEINTDPEGYLYVSDRYALNGGLEGEIWRIHSGTSAYKRFYPVGRVLDARPDARANKNIWFTTSNKATLSRIDPAATSNNRTTWTFPARTPAYSLYGLAIDGDGKIWLTEFGELAGQQLFRFDPDNNGQLCSYTLPGTGNHSAYVVYDSDVLWLGDRDQWRIVRFDPANAEGEVTYWTIGSALDPSEPRGLAMDEAGNLWWADQIAGALRRLTPGTNQVTTFNLPVSATPNMASTKNGKIYYTAYYTADDPTNNVGMIGILNPLVNQGDTSTKTTGTFNSTESCTFLGAGTLSTVSTGSGTITWTASTWTDITPGSAAGWTVYRGARVDAEPYGVLHAGSRLWVSDQTYDKLMRVALPMDKPFVTIRIPTGTTNVELSWPAVDGATGYRVWYSEQPYFSPAGTPDPQAATTFTHSGVAGDVAYNYFYVVRAVNADGESANSNRVGEFTFGLTPGS